MTSSSDAPLLPADAVPGPLPAADLARLLTEYRTCEFATMTRTGMPVAWPAVCVVDTDPFRIRLTTSIGLPRKALNVRRDPRVALLFSDPTGTGRSDLPQVLVQGTAECPDEIRTSPAGLERYWTQLADRQPGSRVYAGTALGRAFSDFYYMRLVITVAPEAVTLTPPLRRPARPERPGTAPAGELARKARTFPDAVLATAAPGALPDLRRVVMTDRPDGALALRPTPGDDRPLPGGPAQLLLHAFDERIDHLRQVAAFGQVEAEGDGAVFALRRLLRPADGSTPWAMLSTVRRVRRSTREYLAERGLERPTIPWDEYRRLFAEHDAAAGADAARP